MTIAPMFCSLRQDAMAGRGPSRLRINKPRPYKDNGAGVVSGSLH
jgi:hypothetical protein